MTGPPLPNYSNFIPKLNPPSELASSVGKDGTTNLTPKLARNSGLMRRKRDCLKCKRYTETDGNKYQNIWWEGKEIRY